MEIITSTGSIGANKRARSQSIGGPSLRLVGGQTKSGRTWYTNAGPGLMRICVGGPWGKNCKRGYVARSDFAKRRKGYTRTTKIGSRYCTKRVGEMRMNANGKMVLVRKGSRCSEWGVRVRPSMKTQGPLRMDGFY